MWRITTTLRLNFEGRVTFFISVRDDDSREAEAILELRAWFSDLTADQK